MSRIEEDANKARSLQLVGSDRIVGQNPAWADYHGGGTILNGWTTVRNVVTACSELSHFEQERVWNILRAGGEVIINNGRIQTARRGVL